MGDNQTLREVLIEKDALRTERDALRENLTWIQKRETELVDERDALKARVAELETDVLDARQEWHHLHEKSASALKAEQAKVAEMVAYAKAHGFVNEHEMQEILAGRGEKLLPVPRVELLKADYERLIASFPKRSVPADHVIDVRSPGGARPKHSPRPKGARR